MNILILGGTGSLGQNLTKALLARPTVKRVTIFSRDEQKQHALRHELTDPRLSFRLGDVRCYEAVETAILGSASPEAIFFVAALKHVPDCEQHTYEAVRTNVLGAQNVIRACRIAEVPQTIAISTDKAVAPVNVMGATKMLQERLFLSQSALHREGRIRFACVRFGNVIGSRGSVLPFFDACGRQGRPIPVTNPAMTRFLLRGSEAVDLTLAAMDQKLDRRILIPATMPAATVGEIAELFSKHYGVPIKI
jgi:UDP-N-acetylglucosamine 4,6-dehydratase